MQKTIPQQLIQLCKEYSFKQCLGQGAFASVYMGQRTQNNQIVALKCIDLNKHIHKQKNQYLKDMKLKLLGSEVDLLKKCNSSNIIKCYDCIQNNNWKVIVLEYCNQGSLYDKIDKNEVIQQQEAIQIFGQLMMGFAVLHKNKIIHRDLKTQNILIHQGTYKIADFGLAKFKSQLTDSRSGSTVGSSFSMAPQIMRGENYDIQADLWSLGLIFFEMLTGYTPFIRNMYQQELPEIYKNIDNFKISEQSKKFLKSVLVIDPKQRLKWVQLYKMFSERTGIFTRFNPQQIHNQLKYFNDSSTQLNQYVQINNLSNQANLNINKQQECSNDLLANQNMSVDVSSKKQQQVYQNDKNYQKLLNNYSVINQILNNTYIMIKKDEKMNKQMKQFSDHTLRLMFSFLLMIDSQLLKIIQQNKQYLFIDNNEKQIQTFSNQNYYVCQFNKIFKMIIQIKSTHMKSLQKLIQGRVDNFFNKLFSNNPFSSKDYEKLQKFIQYSCLQQQHIKYTNKLFQQFKNTLQKQGLRQKSTLIHINNFLISSYQNLIKNRIK